MLNGFSEGVRECAVKIWFFVTLGARYYIESFIYGALQAFYQSQ